LRELIVKSTEKRNGAGDGDRTRKIQLGESNLSALDFQYLQNRSSEMYVHATHTVHALPELRIARGRLGDGFRIIAAGDRRVAAGLFRHRSKPTNQGSSLNIISAPNELRTRQCL
jgi:hypothetical protein